MKIAFLSDIHGNATALEAVLEDIQSKHVDKIVVLGDLCYRGSEPKRSLELVRSLDTTVVKGNADEWVVRGIRDGEVPDQAIDMMRVEQQWTVDKLSQEDIDYLQSLPTETSVQLSDQVKIHALHATPNSLFDIVKPTDENEVVKEKLMRDSSADIYLYGHIHHPYVRYINGKCVANLGSVGLPFDGINHASYLIVEGDGADYSVGIQRVKYDVGKVLKQLDEVEYPNKEFLYGVLGE
ncbi:metallophosphoesterase family protein [Salinibacillus xinjiangensis]|uniref:YfcE family phosphodiesterase n=1 Tax=Salinibacillus xinjiangensis TaxID=1229268 RepID=A0A6G1X295_9BACI|nr:metallophosphoesterase family protein [Salinibacillus xinjiangensis]MRG85020.1 YfcE family phosphodiesterase [Salinibacillus xinjiangensis]